MANHLAGSKSLYLRQHAENPVDWYPWGEDAFRLADQLQRPIFLSIGYSSCHWCHIMEHECFIDEAIAAVLNENFISVKVDREERPDVDDTYMAAVQLASGHGGWPMSLFLTPDKKPFFAGTYIPRDSRGSHPGFLDIAQQVAGLWNSKRSLIEKQAEDFAVAVEAAMQRRLDTAVPKEWSRDQALHAYKELVETFDERSAGFGRAPKFPPHTALSYLLTVAETETRDPEVQRSALRMVFQTLLQMSAGGIHDHVGGGFHRYSTDSIWLLPHFEKMLYDNALLLRLYARAAGLASLYSPPLTERFAATASSIASWLMREMKLPAGIFAAALDADSEGEEGKFYLWSQAEIERLLGQDAPAFCSAYGVKPEGNYSDEATGQLTGLNVLNGLTDPGQFREALTKLLSARDLRPKPSRDDKGLVGWNGLLISAFSAAGLLDQARQIARVILQAEQDCGNLPRSLYADEACGTGFLEDFAAFSCGLYDLSKADGDDQWSLEAKRLTLEMVRLFWDESRGCFTMPGSDHEKLFGQQVPVTDSPIPSGNALAISCLIDSGDIERASRCLASLRGWMDPFPGATEALYESGLHLLSQTGLEPGNLIAVSLERHEIRYQEFSGSLRLSLAAEYTFDSPPVVETNLLDPEVELDGEKILLKGGWPEGCKQLRVQVTYSACRKELCLPARTAEFSFDV